MVRSLTVAARFVAATFPILITMNKQIILNAVGLTPRLLEHAPRLKQWAEDHWQTSMNEVLPAVTCTAQATLLTGTLPDTHGIVANGWLYRDTQEVRFWQQSNKLIQAEPVYVTAKRRAKERGRSFKVAKLFWWFNQGAEVDISITPKPWYGVDGNKVFGIAGTPEGRTNELETTLGKFPFHTFWGPMAGLPCTQWIAECAASILDEDQPDLTFVYLPHLDYDPQRFGPSGTKMAKRVRELDTACGPILDAAKRHGADVWVLSEYGHCDVSRPIYLNRLLRRAGLLTARTGPFGEVLDLFNSRAFAVCDHQLAHIYLNDADDVQRVRDALAEVPGIGKLFIGEERNELNLEHQRSGEIIALSEPDAWFAYPFWLDDDVAPDYARAVAIHHKPGYDPCELFFDPKFRIPKLHAARRLLQKKLGFRMTLDVVPLDASIVRGSHGLMTNDVADQPILIGPGTLPNGVVPMTRFKELLLQAMGLQ